MALKPDVIPQKIAEDYKTNPKFAKLEKISLENCLKCTGQIERLDTKKLLDEVLPKMGFGKYKEKTFKWVQENDPGYMGWCIENISGFAAKAKNNL